MHKQDEAILRSLGYDPRQCAKLSSDQAERNAVYASGNEIIKLYGVNRSVKIIQSTPNNRALLRAQAEQKFSALALEHGVYAPQTLRLGVVSGVPYTVSERMRGTMPAQADLRNIGVWREAGELLGKFHAPALGDGRKWMENWLRYCHTYNEAVLKDNADQALQRALRPAMAWYDLNIRPSDYTLIPFGACHNDFAPRNVICENGHAIGLIDFELSHEGNVELDLADLYARAFGTWPKETGAFFDGYRQSALLAPGFMERLPLYLIGRSLLASPGWLIRFFTERGILSADPG
ncbi:MAG: aminoglycoside phosphotransferase family protein [Bacillota bacterium]